MSSVTGEQYVLQRESIRLRGLLQSDLASVAQWYQNRSLYRSIGGPFRFRSLDGAVSHMQSWLSDDPGRVRMVIADGHDRPIGLISLLNIHPVHRSAQFHILVGDIDDRGQGAGTVGTQLALRHGFEDLGLHRIELELYADNEAAHRLYAACGFRHEGTKRSAYYRFGAFVDVDVLAILAGDYFAKAKERG